MVASEPTPWTAPTATRGTHVVAHCRTWCKGAAVQMVFPFNMDQVILLQIGERIDEHLDNLEAKKTRKEKVGQT